MSVIDVLFSLVRHSELADLKDELRELFESAYIRGDNLTVVGAMIEAGKVTSQMEDIEWQLTTI